MTNSTSFLNTSITINKTDLFRNGTEGNITSELTNGNHWDSWAGTVAIVFSLIIIIPNGISIPVICTSRVLEARIKACFIGQLMTDLLFGLSLLILSPIIVVQMDDAITCTINVYIFYSLSVVTSFMVLLQTLDRFLVLRFTYSYTAWINWKKMVVIIVVIYVTLFMTTAVVFYPGLVNSTCVNSLSFFLDIYIVTIHSFTVTCIACMSVFILKVVIRHSNAIRSATIKPNTIPSADSSGGAAAIQRTNLGRGNTMFVPLDATSILPTANNISPDKNISKSIIELTQNSTNSSETTATVSRTSTITSATDNSDVLDQRKRKIIMTTFIVVVWYLTCYVLQIIDCIVRLSVNNRPFPILETIAVIMLIGNSCVNPLLYIWRLKNPRREWWHKCLNFCKIKKQVDINPVG